jgi:hypothetical protein
MMLFVLTHNIAIILLVKELFYRAFRESLISPSIEEGMSFSPFQTALI